MEMTAVATRILLAAILAGVMAGVFTTAIQHFAVAPLILEAETYENAATGDAAAHAHEDTQHDHEAWAPAAGLERAFFSGLANILTAIGFGLVLTAGFVLGGAVDWRRGIMWGLAGFAAVHLAPVS